MEIDLPAGTEIRPYAALTLKPGEERTVTVAAVKGSAQLNTVTFAE